MLGVQTPAPLIARYEFRPTAYPQMLRQTILMHGNTHVERGKPAPLGAQNLTALGTAATDNGTPAGGGYAGAEPVGAGPSDFARLVCSFHGRLLKKFPAGPWADTGAMRYAGPERLGLPPAFKRGERHCPSVKIYGTSYIHGSTGSVKRQFPQSTRGYHARVRAEAQGQ